MTGIDLRERLREQFGGADPQVQGCPRGFTGGKLGELQSHHKWRRSGGRFGEPLTWKGISVAFTKADHAAEDFSQVTFQKCSFAWTDLRCATFTDAVLKSVTFYECDMEGCDFTNATLDNVSFEDCPDLEKAKFEGATFLNSAAPCSKPNAE